MLKASSSEKIWLAWFTLGVGLLATVFASLLVKQGVEQYVVRQFAFTCDQISLKIQDRLGAYALVLRGGAAFFAASNTVDRKDWRAYIETLRADEEVPGVLGFGFSQVVPAAELAAHIARIRGEGFPEYTIHPPGGRDIYTSVIYLEPFRGPNLRAFGFDMYSEPVRRAAMEQARDTGEEALSGKVELVQETGADVQAGTLMYVPVYRNGMPRDTTGQRRAALIGWISSPYRMNDLMTGILRDWNIHEGKTVDLQIYDGLQATPARQLFDSKTSNIPILHTLFYQQRTIDFNGRKWLLVFDRFSAQSGISYALVWAIMTGGFALNALLFWLMLSVINTRVNAIHIADKLTEEIRHSLSERKQAQETIRENEIKYRTLFETANDGIFLQGATGFLDCNEKGASMYGLAKADVIGRHPCVFSPESQPDGRLSSEVANEKMLAALEGEPQQFEWLSLHNDGRLFDVEITLNRIELNGLVYLQAIVRDITGRKQAEKYEQFRSDMLELLARNEPLPRILEAIARGMEQLYPGMLCSVLLMDNKGRHLFTGAAPSLPDFYNSALDGIEIGMDVGCCGMAAFTGGRVFVNNIAMHPYWTSYKKLAASAGLAACWAQPIRSSSGQVLGVFAIYHHEVRTHEESDITLIEQSARLAGIAIEHKQAEDALRARKERFQLLFDRASDPVVRRQTCCGQRVIRPDARLFN